MAWVAEQRLIGENKMAANKKLTKAEISGIVQAILPDLLKQLGEKIETAVEKGVTASMAALKEEIADLRKRNEDLEARLGALASRPPTSQALSPSQRPYGSPPEGLLKSPNFAATVARAVDERDEREKKRLNLVIVGLPEPQPGLSDNPTATDMETVHALASQMNIHRDKITRVFRHGREVSGRARITKIVFSCPDARRTFLTQLRPLLLEQQCEGGKPPYWVRPDLTQTELEVQRELNKEIYRLRQLGDGSDPVIYQGQIMERQERDRLRGQRNRQVN